MIGDEDFDFNPDKNYHDVINDDELNAELIALGWEADPFPQKKPAEKRKQPSNNQVSGKHPSSNTIGGHYAMSPTEIVDVYSIGDVDESNLKLTADDLEDPDLLSQFEELSGKNDAAMEENNAIEVISQQLSPLAPKITASTVGITDFSPPPISTKPSPPTTASEAKSLALKYKREGNDSEALRWFRVAKQLDASVVQTTKTTKSALPAVTSKVVDAPLKPTKPTASSSIKPTSSSASVSTLKAVSTSVLPVSPTSTLTSSSPSSVSGGDSFAPLEEALNEASLAAGREAKRLETIDKRAAVAKFKEYKAYQQELVVLKSRRQTPGAQPALFRWQTEKISKTIENLEIGEDQIKIVIDSAHDLESVLADHTSRNISVSYCLNIGTKDESGVAPPPIVIGQAKYENGKVDFNYSTILSIIKRGRHVQNVYSRKKATFELTLHRGFFKSNLTLCQAVLPLNDLLSKSEIGGVIPLTAVGAKEGVASVVASGKKGKAVGGSLRISLKLRCPLLTPEVEVHEFRTLIVDPWPAIVSPVVVDSKESVVQPIESKENALSVATEDALANPIFAKITEKEKLDPHAPDLIDSNDVLEYEINYSTQLLASKTLDEDEIFSCQLRLQMLQAKMQILVYNVQNDLITMEDYLEKIKTRITSDQILAVYFKTLNDKENIGHALRILKRVNIMKEELKNAEGAV